MYDEDSLRFRRKGRFPYGYDGVKPTSRRVGDVLPLVLERVARAYRDRPDLIIGAWPAVVGPTVASMTDAESFSEGVLTVRVKNSSLYSLLSQRDRARVLQGLRQRIPGTYIKSIRFRLG